MKHHKHILEVWIKSSNNSGIYTCIKCGTGWEIDREVARGVAEPFYDDMPGFNTMKPYMGPNNVAYPDRRFNASDYNTYVHCEISDEDYKLKQLLK